MRLFEYRKDETRQRRSLGFMNWQVADTIYKRFSRDRHRSNPEDRKTKLTETLSEFRPVEGPINIEQLPAMLASRSVKRYPFSQQDDPAVMYVQL
jgi:hypothetical protein